MNARQWGQGDTRRLTTRDVPAAVLALVDERQGGRFCVACRELKIETPESEPLQIDHKQPLSQGGDNHHLNLQWLCRAHNCARGARQSAPRPPAWARAREAEPAGLLVLLRGIPGAGKSTYARRHYPGALTLSTDVFFLQADGSYRFDWKRLGEAHEACLRQLFLALEAGQTPIVVDKCNLSWRAIEPYALAARRCNYELRVVTLLADPQACWKRNTHGVPRAKVMELAGILNRVRLPDWIPTTTIRTDNDKPATYARPAVKNPTHPFRHWPTRGEP